MANAKWQGEELWHLLNDTIQQLQIRHPNYSEGTIKGKRAYWRRKIEQGKAIMPPKPEQRPEGRLKNTWEVAAYDREANDWTTTTLHSYSHSANVTEAFEPAQPARITPSRAKPEERDHKILFVFSDAQIDFRRTNDGELEPIHDERAIRVAQLICIDLKPDEIISLGDTVDLASLSRFQPDSDHFHRTIGPAFQRVHDMYAQFRSDSPWAKITEVDSNHNTRLKNFVMKYAPNLYGVKQAGTEDEYPVLTYPYLANLGKVGVDWISGYGAAEYVYGLEYDTPPIIFKHGKTVVSNGSTASKESKENPDINIVRGHGHRLEQHTRTTRAGAYLTSLQIGALCRTTGEVPSYHSAVDDKNQVVAYQENWQQTALVIRDYNGKYEYQNIYIQDGKAFYNGKEYSSEA